ncbi:putative adhesin [Endozoicomonas gorgoniicola]|uniref:putative adhesin n=1 Tax=Endozoicomonas gorgoniicola TaxID=1234144 RepID=UPI00389923D0
MPIFRSKPKVNKVCLSNGVELLTCRTGGRKVQSVAIRCHGSYQLKSPGLLTKSDIVRVPPGKTFYFYAPHASVLFSNIRRFMEGEYEPLDTLRAGQKCANYKLYPATEAQKFLDESYLSQCIVWDRLSPNKKADKHPLREYDILRINYPILLSLVIRKICCLTEYLHIHCMFCRSSIRAVRPQENCHYDPALELPPNVYWGDLGRWHVL